MTLCTVGVGTLVLHGHEYVCFSYHSYMYNILFCIL